MTITHSSVQSSEQNPIRYSYYNPSIDQAPLLIFVHGFKGFKDWGAFPYACQYLAEKGFGVVAINLSRNGTDDSLIDFNRLDLFADQTLSQDLDDLLQVIAYVRDNPKLFSSCDIRKLGLIGHSRGGHTVIPAAVEAAQNIKAVVTWASVANYNQRWSPKMIKDWQEQGVTEMFNSRTKQQMRINASVYEDAITNADRLMSDLRVGQLKQPICFIHGEEDEAVSPDEAKRLYEICDSPNKEMYLIPATGHTFGTKHPFIAEEPLPKAFEQLLKKTSQFLKQSFTDTD